MKLRQPKFLVSLLLLLMTVSGCVKSLPPKVEVPAQIDSEPVATSTSDIDTSDWKTYRNEEYGFEILLPFQAVVKALPDSRLQVIFNDVAELKPELFIRVYKNEEGFLAENYFRESNLFDPFTKAHPVKRQFGARSIWYFSEFPGVAPSNIYIFSERQYIFEFIYYGNQAISVLERVIESTRT